MKTRFLLPLLLVSAAFITPASANWFSNPAQGINRNIGSAPNPTPADLREMRTPRLVEEGVAVQGYTVIEPAKDPNKAASAAPQPVTPAQGGAVTSVAADSPSR